VIRAVVRSGLQYGYRTLGIHNGWQGLIDSDIELLTDFSVSGIISRGGTILGTSRVDPLKNPTDIEKIRSTLKKNSIDALVVVGGNGTLAAAHEVASLGIPLVGVPKTIDNDIPETDMTIGFDTAVSVVTEAIDRLHTTAESHHRIMVVQVMGRQAGWIALKAGIAGGADEILIPELPVTMDDVCRNLKARNKAGKKFSIVVVAEGTPLLDIGDDPVPECDRDEYGHGKFVGAGNRLGRELERRLGIETRVTSLGHVQRGGTPTAFDRVLATRFGVAAVEQIRTGNFGTMVALQSAHIVTVPLSSIFHRLKLVEPELFSLAKTVMGGKR
jgi:6-phosphofructokinase 1